MVHIKLDLETSFVIEKQEAKIVLNPIDAQELALDILSHSKTNDWILSSTIYELQEMFAPNDDDDDDDDDDD